MRVKFEKTKQRLTKLNYIKNNRLTAKGEFSSQIYADEILIGEIFATDFYLNLNEYQILMILACICYESREKTEFYQHYRSKFVADLIRLIRNSPFLSKDKRFRSVNDVTALVHPCYHGKTIFDVLKNTNLLEGDLIRFNRQILDRIGQIKNATQDRRLADMLTSIQHQIIDCMKDIDAI